MTDTERLRLREAFRTLQIATVKVREGTVEQMVFSMATNVLGWVLDEPQYREAFETILSVLRERGVVLDPEKR